MLNNKLFNYYVLVYTKDFDTIGYNILVCLYQDYYYIEEELEEERKKQGLAESLPIDLRIYKTLFYNDFDINNKISNLENRVKLLEQKIGNSSNIYQDDNSLYMIYKKVYIMYALYYYSTFLIPNTFLYIKL